jgi:membrane protein
VSVVTRVKERIAQARERRPLLDHAVRTVGHFSDVNGSQQAGGVTYFGFLSVFPILALAFFVVGYVARVYPGAREALINALDQVLPHLIGGGDGEIPLSDFENYAGAVGLIGLAGVLYAGLGWLSALRNALIAVFEEPQALRPNFVMGLVRDLITLVVLGVVLMTSVGLSGVVTRASGWVLDHLALGSELGWLVWVIGLLLGVAAGTVLFFLMFRLLADPPTPARALWSGAFLGAVAFELLKQLSGVLLSGTRGQPAFQAFGISLILLVWINYFSRVVLYAAAWAHTSPAARAQRGGDPEHVQGPQSPPVDVTQAPPRSAPTWAAPFAAGAGVMLTAVAVLRKRKRVS